MTTIYHLQLSQKWILIRTLIKIINFLSNLASLKVWSLSSLKPRCLSWKEIQFIGDVTKNNKITKVYLENMIQFKEVLSLIDLFPRVIHFQLGCTTNTDIELCVQIILMKIIKKSNHDLRSSCFCIPMADDEVVKKLQDMINYHKLIFDYRIKRVCDNIYLQWG